LHPAENGVLDNLGILLSSVMILIVIVQAVRLDRIQPWFQPLRNPQPKSGADRPAGPEGWRRRN
jgi:hypothetical protein